LINEIDRLVEIECEKEEDKGKRLKIASPKSADLKETIIDILVKARQDMFAKYCDLRKQLTLDIKRDFAKKGISTDVSRIELMKITPFALSETVRSRDRYNTAK
jgi:hypothetical protein